jgi:hypothetical protein
MLRVQNFKITKSNTFTEINPLGVYVYNSPQEYFKFGSGVAEIRSSNLRVSDLTVTGNLYVYGNVVSSAPSTSVGNLFTIGDGESVEQTKLKFGTYAAEQSLYTTGAGITSTTPLISPDFIKNGNSVFSTITAEMLVLENNLAAEIPIAIPNEKSYILGSNKLLVFLDGMLKYKTEDYTEVSSTQISFSFDIASGAKILFLIIG